MNRDANCLSYWFPLLHAAGLPVPDTRIVRTPLPLLELCESKTPDGFDAFLAELRAAADAVAGYPCFLRTGQGAGKHNWNNTCFVTSPEDFAARVRNLVEWSEMVDSLGLPWDVWAVRRFLLLDAPFKAFGGMPVAAERRYFVRAGEVICSHPYWPEGALAEASHAEPLPDDWREQLAALNDLTMTGELTVLAEMARAASRVLPGAWSVDLTRDRQGKWWVTDCALAAMSFHWDGCPHAREFD